MDISIEILRNCSFFSILKENELQLVFEKMQKMELRKDNYLFHEGEVGEALFILVSGKLAVTTIVKGSVKTVGSIRPGEIVGELALFADEPRSASIQTVRDSVVLRYNKSDFQNLCYKNPKMLWEITAFIANRAQQNLHHVYQGAQHQVIAFVSVDSRINSQEFLDELEKHNSENYKINFVKKSELANAAAVGHVFTKALEHQSCVFFPLTADELDKNGHLLCFVDKLVVLMQEPADDMVSISSMLDEQVVQQVPYLEKELVLLHQEANTFYLDTQRYLSLAQFSRHYHVCLQQSITCRRLLRRLSGHAVGMVISGGGAKGWAAVGAVQALYEQNIELDYVGGTSAGAGITACYAMSKDAKDFTAMFAPFGKNPMTWRRLTLPLISLFSGKEETSLAKKIFEQIKVEDLALPYFCISTNLSLYTEYVWDNGYLWQAVRASASIPSLVPPVVLDGQLHIDGGVINNFPLDVMANKLGHHGFMLGIEILENNLDLQKYNFSPILNFFEMIRMKFMRGTSQIRYIGIVEILQRVISTGSVFKSKQNAAKADMLIQPNLKDFSGVDFHRGSEMYTVGYEAAIEQLKAHNIPR